MTVQKHAFFEWFFDEAKKSPFKNRRRVQAKYKEYPPVAKASKPAVWARVADNFVTSTAILMHWAPLLLWRDNSQLPDGISACAESFDEEDRPRFRTGLSASPCAPLANVRFTGLGGVTLVFSSQPPSLAFACVNGHLEPRRHRPPL